MEKEGPNDGLVSLKSAKWVRPNRSPRLLSMNSDAQGTYLGTLEGVNHLDLIGWVNTARYKWAEVMGREIKFKPVTFYLGIADHLARVVEGQGQEAGSAAGAGAQAEGEASGADRGLSGGGTETSEEREEREEIRREGERAEMADSLGKGGLLVREGVEPVERNSEQGHPGSREH